MDRDLRFLEEDPEPAPEVDSLSLGFEVSDTQVERLMQIDGVEGVWTREPPVGSRAVVVAISDDSVRSAVPETVEGYPVVFEQTGPIRAQPR